jgi:hypothetical protein
MSKAIDFAGPEHGEYKSVQGSEDTPPQNNTCISRLKSAPAGQKCELISVILSLLCLAASVIWRFVAEKGKASDGIPISISRETLLFSRNENVTESMQLLHSLWNHDCGNQSRMLLQTPMWQNQETGLVMHGSVYALKIYIFPLACSVFGISVLFQSWRCWCFNGTYKPEKGPDFSRWLEYFFTSPLQITIVSISFGFATLDSLLGQCGMQAALVLLGYDIEQQVKKIYKRRNLKQENKYDAKTARNGTARFHHVLRWARITDLRIFVYLGFSWLLHIGIWGIPGVRSHGISGKYEHMRKQLETCSVVGAKIPDAVTAIYGLQLGLFTIFGVVCTWQVCMALVGRGIVDTQKQWRTVSLIYSCLSITAKTALEVGLVSYVIMYKPWIEQKEGHTEKLHVYNTTNTTCWAIQAGGARQ